MEEIGINGMAHVVLTVSRFAECRAFYARLLPRLGMKPVFDGPKFFYCVGARTAIGIEPCDPAHAGERFTQGRVGLHHLCLRARTREDVDRAAALLRVAQQLWRAHGGIDAAQALPLYLRDKVAMTVAERAALRPAGAAP